MRLVALLSLGALAALASCAHRRQGSGDFERAYAFPHCDSSAEASTVGAAGVGGGAGGLLLRSVDLSSRQRLLGVKYYLLRADTVALLKSSNVHSDSVSVGPLDAGEYLLVALRSGYAHDPIRVQIRPGRVDTVFLGFRQIEKPACFTDRCSLPPKPLACRPGLPGLSI